MSESKNTLPKFDSLDALTDFFDENDMGDYLGSMPEAHFEVDLKERKHFVEVNKEIADQLSAICKRDHVSAGTIVNSWLREKLSDYAHK